MQTTKFCANHSVGTRDYNLMRRKVLVGYLSCATNVHFNPFICELRPPASRGLPKNSCNCFQLRWTCFDSLPDAQFHVIAQFISNYTLIVAANANEADTERDRSFAVEIDNKLFIKHPYNSNVINFSSLWNWFMSRPTSSTHFVNWTLYYGMNKSEIVSAQCGFIRPLHRFHRQMENVH